MVNNIRVKIVWANFFRGTVKELSQNRHKFWELEYAVKISGAGVF
jgi:hypothetical protein